MARVTSPLRFAVSVSGGVVNDREGQKMAKRPIVPGVGLVLFGVVAGAIAAPETAEAAPTISVKVILERIRALDDFEGGGNEDFYACVAINGVEQCNEDTPDQDAQEDDEDITPNWPFSNRNVDAAVGTIPIQVEIRDEDGFLRLDDDHADVTPSSGRNLNITLDLLTCTITGDATGSCDQTIITAGTQENSAELRFRIEVGALPSAANLNGTCTHAPVWPQTTDTVTITAAALDGSLISKTVDRIEIFLNDKTTPNVSVTTAATATATLAPGSGTSFFYGCRMFSGSEEIWSGWRVVTIGMGANPGLPVIPIVNLGPLTGAIDLVFFPDKDSYMGATDPQFMSDLAMLIGTYYSEGMYLEHQDQVNFWISTEAGADARDNCDSVMPAGWYPDFFSDPPKPGFYVFADAGAIVHRDASIRDCAPGGDRFFTGDATRMDGGLLGRVFLHETGHRPFGLADEYCCDGGYFQADPFPNVYEEPEDCEDDIAGLQSWDIKIGDPPRTDSSCREFEETVENWFDPDWSVSDVANNHLMDDNLKPRGADRRRHDWLFGECTKAGC